ncbi:MAG: AMP-binding protein [Rhodospirillaceae bacterium]|nr:AMP-binding protein [Rhodospirillaceae bacterium]MYB14580.1 AMP-binding protein [Rhodospirillaceae bacterium]MYI47915.1 AMP-binding protein [Rhodospirillaceae bacterium]
MHCASSGCRNRQRTLGRPGSGARRSVMTPAPAQTPPATYRPLTIATGMRAAAERTPEKIALREGERTLTYAALVDRIDRVSAMVTDGFGLGPGDNAAILAPNCLEYIEIVAGASCAGVAVATLNPRLVGREIRYICDDCGARVLFVHASLAETVRDLTLDSVERIVVLGRDYDALLAEARPLRPAPLPEWSPFSISYTSGTTGEPKGVVLPHRSRVLTFYGMASEYGCYGPDDRYLATAPLFHGAGFAFAVAVVYFGGYCEILPGFDPERVIERLATERLGGTFFVPTHFHSVFALERPVLERYRAFERLKAIVSNAAPLAQATKERIVDYFGEGVLHETYGSTEAGIVTNLRPADQLVKQRCVGLPFVASHVRLLDDDGREVAPGEVGELFSNSPYIFNGYWGKPEETAACFRGDWFSAGDMATRDEEGFVYLVDRKKDMVISGGINIYPREIEEILFRHPGVADVAVIGVPNEKWGEELKGFVVPQPGAAPEARALETFCREHLSPYKVPKTFEFTGALPRNAAGKVLKRKLREA